jgi:hypothetical protein
MPGKRALDAAVEKRVGEVFLLLLRGASKEAILQHLAQEGAPATRTANWYIGQATARFKAMSKVNLTQERGRQLARLEDLYNRLFRIQDYRTALAVAKERSELAGIYPEKVVKNEHSGPNGSPLQLLVGRLDAEPEELRRRLRELDRDEAQEGRRPPLAAPPEAD